MKNLSALILAALIAAACPSIAEARHGAASGANAGSASPRALFTISGLESPESAAIDGNFIYVSNIGEKHPTEKDGDGWIARIDMASKKPERWLTGLNDPKGIEIRGGRIYIADLDEVVIADVILGKVVKRVKVKGAKFLNDVELDPEGNIFASDTQYSAIFRIDGKKLKAKPFMKGMDEAPNGLIVKEGELFVASWGHRLDPESWKSEKPGSLIAIDLGDGSTRTVEGELGVLDGLVQFGDDRWLVSDKMAGKVYAVDEIRHARYQVLDDLVGVADIAYDPTRKMLVAPIMDRGELRAFSFAPLRRPSGKGSSRLPTIS